MLFGKTKTRTVTFAVALLLTLALSTMAAFLPTANAVDITT